MTWMYLFFGGLFCGVIFGYMVAAVMAISSQQARYEDGFRDGRYYQSRNNNWWEDR
jgi:hypothetical protein